MRSVSIDTLQPGMILAKPLSKGNMVILGEGTVLNDAWIERIADMGIEQIYVEGRFEQPIPKEEAFALVDARFRSVLDEPYMRGIRQLVKDHIERLYD